MDVVAIISIVRVPDMTGVIVGLIDTVVLSVVDELELLVAVSESLGCIVDDCV